MYAGVHIAANTLAAVALMAANPTPAGAGLAFGIMLGARLPDHAEQRIYPTDADGKLLVNADGYVMSEDNWCPHRTDTHWVVTWAIGLGLAWMVPGALGLLLMGACIGALIHIALDVVTPLGIPTVLPRSGPRLAIPLFKGSAGQDLMALLLWAAAAFLLATSFKQDKSAVLGVLWDLAMFPFALSDQAFHGFKALFG